MGNWPISGNRLRRMYTGGRADATARRLARFWAVVFSLGLAPRRWVAMEVAGRRSGRPRRFPLGMASWHHHWYLVSMLGEDCNWVQNVRAAHGLVTLRHGRARQCRLEEVPVAGRAPVLRQYLRQVPGARPHFPVSRHAPVADFAAIASRYPVFLVAAHPSRRHWWRWILAVSVAIVLIIAGAAAAVIKLGPSAAALALPEGRVSAPAGPLRGTWQVTSGSLAGFRVREEVIGLSNYIGGQTSAVTGVVIFAGNTVTSARFLVDLTTVKVGGKIQRQFATSLSTRDHPLATFALSRPVTLSPAFSAGRTVTARALGQLTMNGIAHPVTVVLTARRDGAGLQAAGSIPVSFARWAIKQPAGFGVVGSLASDGDAEFLLFLRRQ